MMLATLLTPPGRGAVATIRLEAPASGGREPPDPSIEPEAISPGRALNESADCAGTWNLAAPAMEETGGLRPPLAVTVGLRPPRAFVAASGRPLTEQPIGRVVFGRWGNDPTEEVVVCRVSETAIEIHCHGGMAAVTRILDDLRTEGATMVPWQEWLERTQGQFAAELADALSRVPTERCARYLAAQSESLVGRLFKPSATVEELRELLRRAEFGRHLTEPWQVVLTGRPNVGKSSLANALLGYGRAIVSEQAGTTRDVVTAETAIDGWPVRISDTAGIRESSSDLEQAGVARATAALTTADLRIAVLDTSEPLTADDHRILREWPDALVVLNKCDLPAAWDLASHPTAVHVSCRTGEGLSALLAGIAERLVPEVPPEDTAIPFTARHRALLQAMLQ